MDEIQSFAQVKRGTDTWPLNYRLGMWAWLGQRITGVALVVYLFMHLFVISSAVWREGGGSFDRVLQHFQQPVYIGADLLLLAAIVFHTINGFRILLFDVGIGVRRHKPYFWVLMLIAAVLVLWAVIEAAPYLYSMPLHEPM